MFGHVAVVRDGRIVMRENRAGERFDLAECNWSPSERMPRDRRGLDSAAHAQVAHDPSPNDWMRSVPLSICALTSSSHACRSFGER